MKRTALSVIILLMSLIACTKDEIKSESDDPLLGVWIYSEYQDNSALFARGLSFTDNHCYNFKPDGTLIERKNSGWCGTPPISYSDYNGRWHSVNDTTILVNVEYWGGSTSYYLDIESVNAEFLKVITIPVNQ